MNERLYRSRDDRIIFGVAGGVAENFNLDPSLMRILWVIFTPLTGGLLFVLYVVMAFVVPEEPEGAPWPGWGQPPHTAGGPAAAGGPGADPGPAIPGDPTAAGHGAPVAQMPGFLPPSMASGPAPTPPPQPGTIPPAPPIPLWQPAGAPPGSPPAGPMDWRAQRRADRAARRAARRANGYEGSAGVIGGIVLVLIGGYFIARAYVPGLDLGQFWPVLLVGIGLVLLLGSIRRGDGPPHG